LASKHLPGKWIKAIDELYIFTPSRWPQRELIGRGTALLIIMIFLGWRLYQFNRFPGTYSNAQLFYGAFKAADGGHLYSVLEIAWIWGLKLTAWTIETLIYLGYIASYASRAKAVDIAHGFMETAFPIIIAGTPVIMSLMPYSLPSWAPYRSGRHAVFYLVIMTIFVTGGMLNLIGLWTLRRAFTIMTEARTLITRGIFGYVRHPLYTGHFIMFFGSMLLRLHWATIGMYLFFFVGQVVRAKLEERKLSTAFPEYAQYKLDTGMFLPRIPF
jgi:protein-S-isoprenylcysteine O-methyltransferase Ste14